MPATAVDRVRAGFALRMAVCDMVEAYGSDIPWQASESERALETSRATIVGFDVELDGKLIGRFDGHLYLFGDATPEQFVAAAKGEARAR